MFSFKLLAHRRSARDAARCTRPHGVIQTPAFMPVGTRGAVKAVTQRDLEDLGAEIILGNTYHLYLKPGDDLIARAGGLHNFIGWNRPILTDSGGYQVFSLAAMRRITDEGARVPLASGRLAAPAHAENARPTSRPRLGSDIAMVLDECVASTADRRRRAARRWSGRSRGRRAGRAAACWSCAMAQADGVIVTNPGQAQFGIVQGGVHPDAANRERPGDAWRSASRRTRSAD